jgi:hypothetical protein
MFLLGQKLVDWRSAITVTCDGCFCDVGCVDTQDVGHVACCYLVFVKCFPFLCVLMMFMVSVMVPSRMTMMVTANQQASAPTKTFRTATDRTKNKPTKL